MPVAPARALALTRAAREQVHAIAFALCGLMPVASALAHTFHCRSERWSAAFWRLDFLGIWRVGPSATADPATPSHPRRALSGARALARPRRVFGPPPRTPSPQDDAPRGRSSRSAHRALVVAWCLEASQARSRERSAAGSALLARAQLLARSALLGPAWPRSAVTARRVPRVRCLWLARAACDGLLAMWCARGAWVVWLLVVLVVFGAAAVPLLGSARSEVGGGGRRRRRRRWSSSCGVQRRDSASSAYGSTCAVRVQFRAPLDVLVLL